MTTVIFQPTDGTDAYVSNGADANTNFNTTELYVGEIGTTVSRSFLLFDLASQIRPGANVFSATLDLYVTAGGFGAADPEDIVHRCTSAWTETGVTWNNQPTISAVKMGELSASIVLDVAEFKLMLATNYGLRLRGREDATDTHAKFASSEHATASYHPKLTVECRPVGNQVIVMMFKRWTDLYDRIRRGLSLPEWYLRRERPAWAACYKSVLRGCDAN